MLKKGVFIIESLSFEDEKANRFEGNLLSQILNLGGFESQYFYIRTKIELIKVLDIFLESDYRYLHISCHGSPKSIYTTLDEILFEEFASIIGQYLQRKRLFISACSAVNKDLANQIFPTFYCYSLMGFSEDINFDEAAITWASFYHLIIPIDKMKSDNISETLKKLSKLFKVSINFFIENREVKSQYNFKSFKK